MRLRAATDALSTVNRVNPPDDERQRLEVLLGLALEENVALATQHAAASHEFTAYLINKDQIEREDAEHRAVTVHMHKELRAQQARLLEAEKYSLALHSRLRDLSLKLQRSRLKHTQLERGLLDQLHDAKTKLSDDETGDARRAAGVRLHHGEPHATRGAASG
jgi:hypothetical protein